jgi:hypothetical protein
MPRASDEREGAMRWLTMLLCLSLASCGSDSDPTGPGGDLPGDGDGDAGPATVLFHRDVAPIFNAKCVACHYTGSRLPPDLMKVFDVENSPINLVNTWPEARSKIIIVPGKPDESALMDKIARTDLDPKKDGAPMPWVTPPLTDTEQADLTKWITDGAKDDALYREKIVLIFGDGETLGRKAGKCSFCHSDGSLHQPDLAHPFDEDDGVVNVRALLGGIRVVPGKPEESLLWRKVQDDLEEGQGAPMPRNFERLTEDEVTRVETWIREGARNN